MPLGRLVTLLCCALLVAVAVAGCANSGSSNSSGEDVAAAASSATADDGAIAVPDVSDQDGADAIRAIEGEGLTATPVADDGSNDPDDGSGCRVTDQDPAADSDAAEGDEVTVTMDCRQRDWDNQDGPVWDDFSSGFSDGFGEGCDQLFTIAEDGTLHDDAESEYTETDCENLEPDPSDATDLPTDVPEDPQSEGEDEGFSAGCQALFDDTGQSEFYWGNDSVSVDDCVAAGPGAPPVSEPDLGTAEPETEPAAPKAKATGDTCDAATDTRGNRIRISVDKGKINCAGALALWNAYLDDPRDGQGSGGYLQIDGWDCLSAPAARAKVELGGCSDDASQSAFTVAPA